MFAKAKKPSVAVLKQQVCKFHKNATNWKQNSGILAMEVAIPQQYVDQTKLEAYDKVSTGKYTIGLGQSKMAFVDATREDAVSLCMTAVNNLLKKYNIPKSKIGRLEVGTESPVDKSKSIKSYLMQLFDESTSDLEGSDTINACYGGTNALLNAMYWVETRDKLYGDSADEKYAIVVSGDIAAYNDPAAKPSGGAGAVAMLIGKNAPLKVNLKRKASHMAHAYDFYKPNPLSPYPVVDGKFSNVCYLKSVDLCYDRLKKTNPGAVETIYDDNSFHHLIFHSPYNKLVQKSVGRMLYNDFLVDRKRAAEKLGVDVSPYEKFLDAPRENTYFDNDLEKAFTKLASEIYKKKTHHSTLLPKEIGNSYTASLYICLSSLVDKVGEGLVDKNILAFSYGSGFQSTAFVIEGTKQASEYSLKDIQKVLNLDARLAQRKEVSPEEYSKIFQNNSESYTKNNITSTSPIDYIEQGAFYLTKVDDKWRRTYEQKQ